MNQKIPVYEFPLPEYTVSSKPDYKAVGGKIEQKIQEIFPDRPTIMRCITIDDHPGKSLDELVQIILKLGHDRYDPQRKGVHYPDDIQDALYAGIYGGMETARVVGLFYEGPPSDRNGPPIRIDLLLFYDLEKMKLAPWDWNTELGYVPASHIKYDHPKNGALYWFRNPEDKPSALLGILKILR
jgi:hypothetical protein